MEREPGIQPADAGLLQRADRFLIYFKSDLVFFGDFPLFFDMLHRICRAVRRVFLRVYTVLDNKILFQIVDFLKQCFSIIFQK